MSAPRPLIYEFVGEAKEHLANVCDDLLALEQGKDDSARYRIDRLFRALHSVKGGAGFFGCHRVEELAHAMETVFEGMRQGTIVSIRCASSSMRRQPKKPAPPLTECSARNCRSMR